MKYQALILLLIMVVKHEGFSQNSYLDSLYQSSQSLDDSSRLESYNSFAAASNSIDEINYWIDKLEEEKTNVDSTLWSALILHHYAEIANYEGKTKTSVGLRKKAIKKFRKLGAKERIAKQFNNIGNSYADSSMVDSAMLYYRKALKIGEELSNPYITASSYLNVSTIHNFKGDKEKELENLLKALDISRKYNEVKPLGTALFNLSIYYANIFEFEKSEELLEELSSLYRTEKDLYGSALVFNMKAKLAFDRDSLDLALSYVDSSLQYFEQLGEIYRVASLYMNKGQVQAEMGRLDEARENLWNSYTTFLKIGDKRSAAIVLHDLGFIFVAKNLHKSAIKYFRQAIYLCDSLGVLDLQTLYTKDLYEFYDSTGMKDSAFIALKQYNFLQDSLNRVNNKETIQKMKSEFEIERKELEIKNLQKEKSLQEANLKKQEAQNKALYLGLGAALLLILFISYAFVQKKKDNQLINSQKQLLQKQNEELNEQKDIVEEKNREITDSINYAKRIQEAVLPPKDLIKNNLPNSFILYLPKDIVAGDFYWHSKVNDTTLIAAADCTGHGVPGAMVSVVCSNALNRAVSEYGLKKPFEILNKCQEMVVEDLGSADSEIRDGMDIALCSINLDNNKVEFSGAHNPLWIVGDKPEVDAELIHLKDPNSKRSLWELKSNKQSIGNLELREAFKNFSMTLKKGSRIYLFSDGYLDQFGGARGKKLKSKNLKELILSIQDLAIEDQEEKLRSEFLKWKGDLEQVDDICVIGIEV